MCSAQNSFRKRSLFAFCFFCGICLQYGFSQTLVMHRNVVPDGYSFWVSTPPDYDSSDAAKPIMLFLHGNSLCGRDLERVRRCGPLHAQAADSVVRAADPQPQAAAVYHTVRKGGTLGAIAPKSGSLFYGFLKKVAHFFCDSVGGMSWDASSYTGTNDARPSAFPPAAIGSRSS